MSKQITLETLFRTTSSKTDFKVTRTEHHLNSLVNLPEDNGSETTSSQEIAVVVNDTGVEAPIDSSDDNEMHLSSHEVIDHDYENLTVNEVTVTTDTDTLTPVTKKKTGRYLPSWEKQPEAFYKTYVYDVSNVMKEKLVCWLYNKKDQYGNDGLGCKLCEKHRKTVNSNGKRNLWCTTGYQIMKLSKIKEHRENDVHQQAQKLELETVSQSQPNWIITQTKERSKHEIAVQNLIYAAVYICQQDQSINSFEKLCTLIECLGVKLLPAELGGISYRNDNAALEFLRHVASYLHEELIEKVKQSRSIGWMLDESTSRTVEKSLIVYARYFDNDEAKTSFYGIIGLDGDGSADNIVNCIKSLWRQDDLNPERTCWFASDNAATFTGINNGVIAKLKRDYGLDFVELNPCAAHSFALVGSRAGYAKLDNEEKTKKRDLILKLENVMSKIYQYFGSSASRSFKLRCWQNLLDSPELKFKQLFSIRWTSIRDSIKPIMLNITPTNQALLATLQEIKHDNRLAKNDRETAADLLSSILDDEFLFMLHFHYDLQECILGELTKLLQDDDLPYFTMMNVFNEKKIILNNWLSQGHESQIILGPSLTDYVDSTCTNTSYGAFEVVIGNRIKLFDECFTHLNQLLLELDKRFKPSRLQQCFIALFEPGHLINNKNDIMKSYYGRYELDFLREKYQNLNGFNTDKCRIEWETLKISLHEFLTSSQQQHSRRMFWKSFILWSETNQGSFYARYENITTLLSIYLISPLNSAECERGYSVANRIQTNGRSRIMIQTLEVLMNVRLLFPTDMRSDRAQEIIGRAYNSWSGKDENRRVNKTKLLIDVPDDYCPVKQSRPGKQKRRLTLTTVDRDIDSIQAKRRKPLAIKCSNRCGKHIAQDDPNETNAIQCCHQQEYYNWIDSNCSRWLCNTCRIKLGISTDTISWFCDDCIDMHQVEQ